MLKNLFVQILIFSVAFTAAPLAFAVSESDYSKVYDLLNDGQGSFYQQRFFIGAHNKKIFYTQYGKTAGSSGSVIIAPGRTESSLKYLEVAYDLIQQGFSPIFVIDHRGQGFSDRLLDDPQKGYIPDYAVYESDFGQFIELVGQNKKVNKKKLFLLSHSMGGTIVTEYLMKHPTFFRAAAFISPMYKINNERTEMELIRDTGLACYVQFSCNDYIPDGGPFDWKNRHFSGNDLTHSLTRFNYRNFLWKKWPQLQLGDPTIRWVRESVQADIRIRNIALLSKINIPFVIFQGDQDTVVKGDGAAEVCKRMKAPCLRLRVKGARHEILMEKDSLRSAALDRLVQFFKTH